MPNQTQREAAVRVLICEHNLAVAEDMAENLGGLGYEIAGIVVTGDEAIRTAEEVRPDVILMDIDLPGVPDGVKAADHIITYLDITVVYLTGYAEHAVRERSKKSEPYGYLDKPVGLSQLRSIVAMTSHRRKAELQARKTSQLLEAINQAQSQFISGDDPQHVFDGLLCELLSLTGSEYGFIDEIFHTEEGIPYRVTHAITNIAWNEETQRFYDEHKSKGFTFYNHNNLSGATMLTGRPVISNDPNNHPRSGGLPKGHPPLKAFLGLPLHSRQKLIGTVGLANRAGGYDEEIVTFLEPYLATCANIIEAYRNEQDRKHAEEVLRESEQRYRTILGTAMDGFWLVDMTGKFLEVNDAYCHMSGYNREELLGMTIPELEAEKTSEDAAAPFWKVVEKGADRFESAHRRKDGNQMHCEMSVRFLPVDGGLCFAFIRDITERKKMDAALKEIQHQQKALLDNIPDIAWLKDKESRFIAANQPFGKACGVAPEDLPGKTDLDVWPVELAERHRTDDREVMTSGKRKRVEEPVTDKDGNTTWVETIKTPIYNDAGENIGTAGIARDITERKRAEEDLRRSEAKFLDLYENAPSAYFSVGTDAVIRLCNRRAEQLLGYTRAEMIGKWVFELYADKPDGKEKAGTVFKRFLAGDPIADEELQMQKSDGSVVWISLTVNGIRNSKGHLVESRSMVLDISERKRTEEALRRLNRELRAISTCNQTLLRAVDEQTLINDVCSIVCKEAGYRLAWVGYAENDDAKTIRPVAWAGFDSGYVADAKLSWSDDTERGQGAAGTAIRTGEIICVQDFTTDPQAEPWRELAAERGYRSCLALPLKDEGENTFGILCIYSTEPNAFTPDEMRLLEELSGDLAFGITVLRARIERRRADDAVKKSQVRLKEAQRIAHIGSWELDIVNNVLTWSDEMYRLFEIDRAKFGASYEAFLDAVHPDDRKAVDFAYTNSVKARTPYAIDHRLRFSDGRIKHVHEQCETHYNADGKPLRSFGTVQDITERKLAEESLRRLNRELQAVSNCNQALMRAVDEQTLLNEICRIVCNEAGYCMAWVGFAEKDEAKTIRPVAWAGVEDGYLADARLTWADTERGRGPAGIAVRDGESAYIQDFTTDPQAEPWRELAAERGYRSCLALPLKDEGENTFGILCIYSTEPNAFTPDEMRLLEELSGDLAFGITVLRARIERRRAENIMRARLRLVEYASSHSLEDLLQATLDEVEVLTDSSIGFYHFLEADQRTLRIQAWSTRTLRETCTAAGKGLHYDIDKAGVWTDCVHERKPVIHNDYAALPHRRGMPKGHANVIRELVVPVFRSDRITAILGVGNKPVDYDASDVDTVSLLADLAWDIAERKQAEEKNLRLAAIVESSDDAIIGKSLHGIITSWNKGAENIYGYKDTEAVGKPISLLIPPDRPNEISQFLERTVRGEHVEHHETVRRRKDGQGIHVSLTISPVRNAEGRIIGASTIARDITDQKNLQRQLLQAQKMEAVGTLAGGIAHDFNNVLQVVLGYTDLVLTDHDLPDRLRGDMEKVLLAGRNGADLVQRLLTFSRKTEPKLLDLDLNQRIRQTQKFLQRSIPTIDIELILAEELARIQADPTQLDQVLMNLAVNARDAMPEGGHLTIKTANAFLDEEYTRTHLGAKPGEYVLLRVSDTGCGMDRETLEYIFEPFFTTKEAGKGTGLGLAMVYGIVKQHGGYITCYSELGHGTIFKIYFPALLAESDRLQTAARETMPAGGTETIVLADNEEFVRDLGKKILERSGYTVLTAANGKECLDLYREQRDKISLVILDLIMPEMGGKECLERLLKIEPRVKVLIASGFSAEGRTKDTIETGARGLVDKPFDIRQMLHSVREVLDSD